MAYADITINDPNPIKSWLQNRRFLDALKIVQHSQTSTVLRVLDFGAGDGELILQIARIAPVDASVFEPTPSLMLEAKEKLAHLNSVTFIEDLNSLKSGTFDIVFCLEVFEHLPKNETNKAIKEIHRLLKPDGFAVIGVPHELFLPALFKGIFRIFRRYGAFDARFVNVLAAFIGRPPLVRPISEIATGVRFHFEHLGFDYRSLDRLLQKQFRITKRWFSPFSILGPIMNSEVYFLLEPITKITTANREAFNLDMS